MNVTVTIKYTTDEGLDGSGFPTVHDSIASLLDNTLPYMVDNVSVHFGVEDE